MKFKSKLLSVLAVFGVLVALSPAPFVHKHASSNVPKTTQSELAKDLSKMKVMDIVGSPNLHPTQSEHADRRQRSALSPVAKAEAHLNHGDKKKALAVLKTAEQQVESAHHSPLMSLFWVVVAGCFGYGTFFAFRKWADKNIPDPSSKHGRLF